jgi:predicted nicotinamide N-methyase
MAKKKKSAKSNKRQAYGITVLKASHKKVRQLKEIHAPEIHGNKFWTSSWLIMDYLEQQGLPPKARVLEAGCGWGLAGIYCAKRYDAMVTGVDADDAVFPYLDLHAAVNGVQIETMKSRFEDIKKKVLSSQDILLGSDVCFWENMVDPLYKLVGKAIKAGVQQVILADPGRPPFEEMCGRCVDTFGGVTQPWAVEEPVRASGTLLIVGSLPHKD